MGARSENHRQQPWLNGIATKVQLIRKTPISHDVDICEFALPEKHVTLGISTCSCILVSPATDDNDENENKYEVISSLTRPYTPISPESQRGSFTLLMKRYPTGAMSQVFAKLKPHVSFITIRQIPFNIKIQYPFENPSRLLMLAAGTGITPMYQALQKLFGPDANSQLIKKMRVILVFGCRNEHDCYLRKELEAMQERYPEQLRLIYAMSRSTNVEKDIMNDGDGSIVNESTGRAVYCGRTDRRLLERICLEEGLQISAEEQLMDSSFKVFVCGPPSFYESLCGPRNEPEELTGILADMGFVANQVVKF